MIGNILVHTKVPVIKNHRNKWSMLMPNPSKDQNKYPYVTLAFDDWKYSSAHKKGSSNHITMKNHFQVMFFRQKKHMIQSNLKSTPSFNKQKYTRG